MEAQSTPRHINMLSHCRKEIFFCKMTILAKANMTIFNANNGVTCEGLACFNAKKNDTCPNIPKKVTPINGMMMEKEICISDQTNGKIIRENIPI